MSSARKGGGGGGGGGYRVWILTFSKKSYQNLHSRARKNRQN